MRALFLLAAMRCAATPTAASPSSVTWAFAWDEAGLVREVDGGWTTTTDLGVRVHVTRAELVTFTASLVPCETHAADAWVPWSSAWAGHGGFTDPTHVVAPVHEDVVALRPTQVDTGPVPEATYCQVHALLARDATAASEGTSLRLDGTWAAPDGRTGVLALRTARARGVVRELSTGGTGAWTVTLTRHPARWFDGIRFVDGEDVATDVLTAVLDTMTVEAGAAEP